MREYNATYDYFRGMDDESLAKFRQAETIGHRPTWKMGSRGGAAGAQHVDETIYAEARAMRRRGARRAGDAADAPRYNALALKALNALDLDANGGDRSSEDKLREIIQAYNYLRANKLV